MLMKKIGLFSLVLALTQMQGGFSLAASSDCKPKHDLKTVEEGVLTVAAYQAPPYIGIEDNKLVGVDGEVLARIAELNCLKAKPMTLDIAAVIQAVQSGRADVASGDWYLSKSRAKVMGVTEPIYRDNLSIVSPSGFKTLDALVGERVGTLQGNMWNDDLQKLIGSTFTLYQSQQSVYTDLKNGRLDAVIDAAASSPAQLKLLDIKAEVTVPPPDKRVGQSMKPALNTFPIKKGNDELVKAINDGIKEMRDSGELKAIFDKYGFPEELRKLPDPIYLIE
ncbi:MULTISPECIES: substrate-binding periplasmic protein [unclassified Mesorhizobium]|uniref:substrate-binding periplasmic protein n=1 Tax=unclassified Mesorhizobium TaxID=325217 RepID=UPI000466133D|nr:MULTISPECIES: transporter substrate-binding domain-containing protein [unclassified Mesorhizobium]